MFYWVFFITGPPPKISKYRKGVSRTIYVNVDSPNLGFSNFLGGTSEKNTLYIIAATVQHPLEIAFLKVLTAILESKAFAFLR